MSGPSDRRPGGAGPADPPDPADPADTAPSAGSGDPDRDDTPPPVAGRRRRRVPRDSELHYGEENRRRAQQFNARRGRPHGAEEPPVSKP
ncbi:MAG: hypothetical protein ACRDZN_16185, partial [Acidimicrobiales bacterium]